MIKINNVTKKYGDTVILENCDYDFPSKGIVCLLGASGGGKTTLLNLLAGFDTNYQGEIIVGGEPINNLNEGELCRYRKDNIGFVFQNYHLLMGHTVLENVTVANELQAAPPNFGVQNAKSLLKKLGLSDKENQKIETLSGGQKQRVAIARALVNDPQIIFADEPTGALDRSTSIEIMELLQSIAQKKLVIVITHDKKICDFADEIIHIKDKKIVSELSTERNEMAQKSLSVSVAAKTSPLPRAKKNFSIHLKRYAAVSLAISVGVLAFLFSLSFGNVMESSIEDFKAKNTAFNNGYIKGKDNGTTLALLESDARIENAYFQYKLGENSLTYGGEKQVLPEKFPTPKALEGLSYGVMPRFGENEIALTPSLAKKFDADIKSLISKEVTQEVGGQKFALTISGIFNAGYDDFIVSADVEQKYYANMTNKEKQDNYSISYDVANFSDIVNVSKNLKQKGITSVNAATEVYALEHTFDSLNKLFLVISVLILGIGLFICAILLFKLQNTRYRELGLLSALGFSKHHITGIISVENLFLAALATMVNLAMLSVSVLVCKAFSFQINISSVQVVLSVCATFAVILILSFAASFKLVRTEPADALRK